MNSEELSALVNQLYFQWYMHLYIGHVSQFCIHDMINSNQTVNNSNLIRNHQSDIIDLFQFNGIADNWVINGNIHRIIKFNILRN